MDGSVGWALAWAVLLFWALGAYNRLVRLRAQVLSAFAPLAEHLARYGEVVDQIPSPQAWEAADPRVGLLAAWRQFELTLKAARAQPLDALALQALGAAQVTVQAAWSRLCQAPSDLAGEPLPPAWLQQWTSMDQQSPPLAQAFNRHIADYNDAIAQFPAAVLAWLFGFKPGHPLHEPL